MSISLPPVTFVASPEIETFGEEGHVPLYRVVLLDDDDHTMDYVVEMLNKLFGYPAEKGGGMVETLDSSGRVIVMTTTAGGVAITLDMVENVHILDETWVPDDQEQLADRAVNTSRMHQVGVYVYRSKDTVEELAPV